MRSLNPKENAERTPPNDRLEDSVIPEFVPQQERWTAFAREIEMNPLYRFLSGRAYGKRRWWLLGGRERRIHPRLPQWLHFLLVVALFVLGVVSIISNRATPRTGISLLPAISILVWAAGSGRGTLKAFLKTEYRSERLEALVLTGLTSRDWAVGWVGARLWHRPRLTKIAGLVLLLFWPVVSLCIVASGHSFGGSKIPDPFNFVLKPSLGFAAFLVLAAIYRTGNEVIGLSFELGNLEYRNDERERVAGEVGGMFAHVLYFLIMWVLPALFGAAVGAAAGFWGFLTVFVAASLTIHRGYIKPQWEAVQSDFLPALAKFTEELEESKGARR